MRAAAGEMGEVRADRAARRRAGDMRGTALHWRRGHVIVAGLRQRRRRRRRGLQLMVPPFEEVGIAVDVDDERHVRVLRAAEFGALAAVDADLARDDA